MEDMVTLVDKIKDLDKRIKELEREKLKLEREKNEIQAKSIAEQYPLPEELSWDYIFSVPEYVFRISDERRKKYDAFTGEDSYYYPVDLGYINTNTGKKALGINLHFRYPAEHMSMTIDILTPIVEAAIKHGEQAAFFLRGDGLRDGLMLFRVNDKWFIDSARFSDPNKEPSYPDWSGDSWKAGIVAYYKMRTSSAED
jgi:hypothetical protein